MSAMAETITSKPTMSSAGVNQVVGPTPTGKGSADDVGAGVAALVAAEVATLAAGTVVAAG
jgi:hypothetical protein